MLGGTSASLYHMIEDLEDVEFSLETGVCMTRLYTEVCDRSVTRTLALLGGLMRQDLEAYVLGVKCKRLVAHVIFAAMVEGGMKRVRRVVDIMCGGGQVEKM